MVEQPVTFSESCTWIEFGDDPELLPLRALRLMQEAEIVFYDRACPFGFVDLVRRDAERVSFQDITEAAEHIRQCKVDGQRVVVFIDPASSAYRLLKESDNVIELGRIK